MRVTKLWKKLFLLFSLQQCKLVYLLKKNFGHKLCSCSIPSVSSLHVIACAFFDLNFISYIPAEANTCRTAWLVPVSKPKVWQIYKGSSPAIKTTQNHTVRHGHVISSSRLSLHFLQGRSLGTRLWQFHTKQLQVSHESHYHPLCFLCV